MEKLELTTLEDRRKTGNLIMMFKAVGRIENVERDDLIKDDGRTRNHKYKLKKIRCLNVNVKKFSFHSTVGL